MNLYLLKAKCLTFFCCLLFTQTVLFAQSNIKITIKKNEITLRAALTEVEKQSKMSVAYNESQLGGDKRISLNINNKLLDEALDIILKGTGFSHKIKDGYIMIVPAKKEKGTPKKVQGRIIDEQGEALIGVNVSVNGAATGTITDMDGNYAIDVFTNDVLKVSYIGYVTQLVKISDKNVYNITMNADTKTLDEVVVTALGIKRETKALTYNVQEIKAAGITKVKDANFVNSLAGKVAGVTINQSSSGVGGSTRVVMRGTKSLFGENNALYVLDGIPMQGLRTKQSDNYYESTEVADGDGISNINPEDIESMSVLTGASAAALYGNRGANGVILITTKKGAIGKPRISYSNSTNFMSPFVTPKFQNTYGRKEGEFKSWGDKLVTPSSYDPMDFFQTGYSTMNSFGLSTGSETHQTHVSIGAVNSEGIIHNNTYNRYNFTLRNTSQIIKDVLELDMSLYYVKQNNQNSNGQGMYYNPLVPVYLFPPSDDINKYVVYERYDEERKFKTQYWPYGNQSLGMQNPYWIINRNMFNTDRDRYIITAAMKWNVTKWMNVIGRARIDNAYSDFERKLYASTDGLFANTQGGYMKQDDENKAVYLDFLVNIDKTFGQDYRLLVNFGGSFYDEKYEMSCYEGQLLKVPNFFHPTNIAKTESGMTMAALHTQTQSVYGKAELAYKNFLYMDVTGRLDFFSTLLGTSQNYVFYPSVGLSVVLSEILPLPKDIFSFWKIRGSYAQVGNPPEPYLTYPMVALEGGSATSGNFTPATHLKPEMTKSFELGMDLRFFNDKINIAATYYNSNTYNQLFKYKLPPSTGYAYSYENAGKVNNWGIELSVGVNQKLGPVDWNANLIYSMNRNEIKELLPEYVTDRQTGAIVKAPLEFEVAGAESYRMILKKGGTMSDIYATKLRQDYNGNILVDGGVQPEENTFVKVGTATPKYNLGFRNSFAYKGLELDFLIDARVGGQVVSATQALMDQFGVSEKTAIDRDNGGVTVNKGKLNAESYYSVVAAGKTGLLAHYAYSATNVRLREVSLTYHLPNSWFNNKVNLSVSLTGRNLCMFYNKAPFDPELTANTGTYYQGFDYFMPPSQRNIGFGVKLNF